MSAVIGSLAVQSRKCFLYPSVQDSRVLRHFGILVDCNRICGFKSSISTCVCVNVGGLARYACCTRRHVLKTCGMKVLYMQMGMIARTERL